ncbi:MAG: hypothetical protein AB8G95_26545, partial [Anaerolineae bacterium]
MLNTISETYSLKTVLIGTALLILCGYFGMFYVYYSDTLGSITLPYFEDFSEESRVEYRQIGGNWTLENASLVQQDSSLVDIMAVIPALELDSAEAYEFSATVNVLDGPKGGGLAFNLQDHTTVISSHMVRLGTDQGQDYLIYGYFDDNRQFVTQGSANPENLPNEFKLGVVVDGDSYVILLNEEVITDSVPVIYAGGSLGLTTWYSKVAFDNVVVKQPGAPSPSTALDAPVEALIEEPKAETVVAEVVSEVPVNQNQNPAVIIDGTHSNASWPGEVLVPGASYRYDFAGDGDFNYKTFTGDWAINEGSFVQNDIQLVDVAAAINDIYLSETAQYEFKSDFNTLEGPKGAGLIFNMQRSTGIQDSHMLRLGNNGTNDFLIFGYFDDQGVFNQQGAQSVSGLANQGTLAVNVGENTYSIILNDQTLAVDIPLVYRGGGVGITTWKSRVAFDNLNVSVFDGSTVIAPEQSEPVVVASERVEVEPVVSSLPFFEDFSNGEEHFFTEVGGNWQLRDEMLVQLNAAVADVLAIVPGINLGTEEPYNFSTQFEIIEGSNGAGLMFNLQNSDSIREGHLVRFGSNGDTNYMVYGYFDENRSFSPQGTAEPPPLTGIVNVGVSVNGNVYNILVNEEIVARDIPLVYLGGRVALTSWNSSLAFDNVSVEENFIDDSIAEPEPEPAMASNEDEVAQVEPVTADSTAESESEASVSESEPEPVVASNEDEVAQTEPATADSTAESEDFFANPRPINSYFKAELDASTSFSNWRAIAGEWEILEEGIVHSSDQEVNSLIAHANLFDTYILKVNFEMGQGAGGSGVAFNISSIETIAGTHIVRFIDDESILWGYFDDAGVYVEQGTT